MEIKDFKMVVTPYQSKIIQEFLFTNGYSWVSGTKDVNTHVYINIVLDFNSGKLSYLHIDDLHKIHTPEITFEQFQELYMKETKQEKVNHPNHYTNYPIEVIDMMISIFGKEDVAKYCLINAYKYRMRLGLKNPDHFQEDFEKEQWYLNKYKELSL